MKQGKRRQTDVSPQRASRSAGEPHRQRPKASSGEFPEEQSLLDSLPIGCFRLDGRGRIRAVNLAGAGLLGVDRDTLLGQPLQQFVTPEDRERFAEFCRRTQKTGTRQKCEVRLGTDGRVLHVILEGNAAHGSSGRSRHCRVAVVDITERKRLEAELRESETQNRLFLDLAGDAVFTADPETGMLLDANEKAQQLLLRSLDEVRRMHYSELHPPEQAASSQSLFRGLAEQERSVIRELCLMSRDGRRVPVEIVATIVVSSGRRVAMGIFRDVTERQRAEAAHQKTLDRLSDTLHAIPDLMFELDQEGRILSFYAPPQEPLYARPAEFVGRTVSEVLPPESARIALQAIAEAARQGWHRGATYALDMPDGRRWYELSIAARRKVRAGEERFIALARDVTASRQALESLRLSEQRLRLHVQHTALGVIEWDTDFRVIRWNPAAEQIFGYTAAEALGQHASLLVPASARAQVDQAWSCLLSGKGGGEQSTNENATKAGHTILCEWHNTPLTTAEGEIVGVASAVQDITERKGAEAALAEAKAAAEAANRSKSEFLTKVSHELRTPLHAVLGMTELALRDKLPPAVQTYVRLAQSSADMVLELLNEILDFSRMEASRIVLEQVAFNLRTTLDETMKVLGAKAQAKGLELCWDMPRHVPVHLIGDPIRIRRIATNLVGNAIKFTEHGEVVARVAVQSCAAETVALRFSVTDTGIGISREDQTKIFEPFVQADASITRRYGGTGLGLAIASKLAQLMGGRLSVESEPGRGSTFLFTAPFRLASEAVEPALLETAFLEQLRNLPVLVVDDQATNRQILCDTLTGWSLKPEVADCAPTALAHAQQALAAGRPFRLAVVDADLASLDDWALIRQLCPNRRRRAALILLVSSTNHPALEKRRGLARMALYLGKPVTHEELLRAVVRGLGLVPPSGPRPESTGLPIRPPRSLRILLAEDTPASRLFATEVLRERGHAVQTAENGRRAFELVQEQDFDVVLMDVQMPVMDGFQATAAIRALAEPAKSRLPIVAITAHAIRGDEQRCLTAGMDGYLSKPLRSRRLIETVERLAAHVPVGVAEARRT